MVQIAFQTYLSDQCFYLALSNLLLNAFIEVFYFNPYLSDIPGHVLVASYCLLIFVFFSVPLNVLHMIMILEWVPIPFSRGSSRPRDQTWVSCVGRQILYHLSHEGSPTLYFISGNSTPRSLWCPRCLTCCLLCVWHLCVCVV